MASAEAQWEARTLTMAQKYQGGLLLMSTQSKWGTWNSIAPDFIEAMPPAPLQEQGQKSQKNRLSRVD